MSLRVTDLYCGCGGSTTGAAAVPGVEVTEALNHWEPAIESLAANHPHIDPKITDLFKVHPACFDRMDFLLASPECTTHSPASGTRRKGLQQLDFFDRCNLSPDKVKSRATMWTVTHWASVHRPLFVIVENVVELNYWPELPAWFTEMKNLGYEWEEVYVNAMHVHGLTDERVGFMAPQSRDRVYIVFWKKGNPAPDLTIRPLAPCEKCRAEVRSVQVWKNGRTWGRYRRQYVYACPACASIVEPYAFAAANAINWSLPSVRIGEREKYGLRPLMPKTRARIQYGQDRWGLIPYTVINRYSSGVECRVRPVLAPFPTQPSQPVAGLVVQTAFSHSGDGRVSTSADTLPAQTGRNTLGLVVDLAHGSNGERGATPAARPFPVQTTAQTFGLVVANRTHGRARAAEQEAMPAATTGETIGLVTNPAALCTLRGSLSYSGLDGQLNTQTGAQQTALVGVSPYLVSYYGTDNASSAWAAIPTVTTVDRHALVEGDDGKPDIDDLYFRMFDPEELKVGTGHPAAYKLIGTKREKVKLVGNSNFPGIEQLLVERLADTVR